MAETGMVERVAKAMKKRAAEPVANLPHLENVLVGSLGDAWPYLAAAAIEAMLTPTDEMCNAGADELDTGPEDRCPSPWDMERGYRAMLKVAAPKR